MPTPVATRRSWLLPGPVRQQLFGALVRLGVTGLLAIGVSGALAWGMGETFDERYVAGDFPGVTYTKERCADYFEYQPDAVTCEEAATGHHFWEVVQYRIAAGFLGLLALGASALLKRRWRGMRDRSTLPAGFEATVGTAIFGLAAVALLGQSLEQFAVGDTAGVGQFLSGGLISAAVAAFYGLSLYRTLLRPIA